LQVHPFVGRAFLLRRQRLDLARRLLEPADKPLDIPACPWRPLLLCDQVRPLALQLAARFDTLGLALA